MLSGLLHDQKQCWGTYSAPQTYSWLVGNLLHHPQEPPPILSFGFNFQPFRQAHQEGEVGVSHPKPHNVWALGGQCHHSEI